MRMMTPGTPLHNDKMAVSGGTGANSHGRASSGQNGRGYGFLISSSVR